jgi:hypothetical protein
MSAAKTRHLAEHWEKVVRQMYAGQTIGQDQRDDMQASFYAGAMAFMQILASQPRPIPEGIIEEVFKEVEEFGRTFREKWEGSVQ